MTGGPEAAGGSQPTEGAKTTAAAGTAGAAGRAGGGRATKPPQEERRARYRECRRQLEALLEGESDLIARMCSALALLREVLPQASFLGFYRALPGAVLVAGPYQGPAACLRIRFGQGVCGTSAAEERSLLVPDVHAFPGHIACDSAARSELVVPVRSAGGELIAVLDLDSHDPAAFDLCDQEECERLVTLIAPRS